jgi:hypothetical protein
MNIGSEEKIQIARLFHFLLSGEQIAHRCARMQAKLCHEKQLTTFFKRQARQEKFHAFTFQSAISWLAPKGVRCPASAHMQQYDNLLHEAHTKNDLLASVLGLQVILEGMGDIVLAQLNADIEQRDIGYRRIRRAIIKQEDTHHATGLAYLENNLQGDTISDHQRQLIDDYLSIIGNVFSTLYGLLEYFDCDADDYIEHFNRNIPYWIHRDALGHHPGA